MYCCMPQTYTADHTLYTKNIAINLPNYIAITGTDHDRPFLNLPAP